MKPRKRYLAWWALSTMLLSNPSWADVDLDESGKLKLFGDVRFRFESDFDSQRSDGEERNDRDRARIRLRAGLKYNMTDHWLASARVRTGNSRSQQSPHLTFKDFSSNDEDDLDFVVDKAFVQFTEDSRFAWGGRNTTPYWQQNEFLWDADVPLTGLAGSLASADRSLTATAGAFFMPDGGYNLHGQMVAGQMKYTATVGPVKVITAGGLFYMNGKENATNLRNRNGERDYLIGAANVQGVGEILGTPLTLGADLFYNFEDYDAADVAPFPVSDDDEVLGYAVSLKLGQLKEQYDWLLAYYYAHIETFAVNASYAQDDWVRFGSATQTDSSDIEGHEFRVAFNVTKNLNAVARLYLVDAITTDQDGTRFRFDLNYKF